VQQHPDVAPAVQQIATQQETDMAVAEAMRRLKIFNSSSSSLRRSGGCGPGPACGAPAHGACERPLAPLAAGRE
jgi:hypothetical protein